MPKNYTHKLCDTLQNAPIRKAQKNNIPTQNSCKNEFTHDIDTNKFCSYTIT